MNLDFFERLLAGIHMTDKVDTVDKVDTLGKVVKPGKRGGGKGKGKIADLMQASEIDAEKGSTEPTLNASDIKDPGVPSEMGDTNASNASKEAEAQPGNAQKQGGDSDNATDEGKREPTGMWGDEKQDWIFKAST